MDYIVRKARESDNINIAKTIAYSFEKSFSVLTKDIKRMAKAVENGIVTDRFYVAEQNEILIGVVGCGDCTGRVFKLIKDDFKKHLGSIRGQIAYKLLYPGLMRPHNYPATTGYIDIIGVLQQARGKKVAKELLNAVIENNPQYNEFILDTDSINASAIKSYTNFGFVEFKRWPDIKLIKRNKVFMKYTV